MIARLAGRCADGAERGSGSLWHFVPEKFTAACGATYGRRSAGWVKADPSRPEEPTQPTCPRCLKSRAWNKENA